MTTIVTISPNMNTFSASYNCKAMSCSKQPVRACRNYKKTAS